MSSLRKIKKLSFATIAGIAIFILGIEAFLGSIGLAASFVTPDLIREAMTDNREIGLFYEDVWRSSCVYGVYLIFVSVSSFVFSKIGYIWLAPLPYIGVHYYLYFSILAFEVLHLGLVLTILVSLKFFYLGSMLFREINLASNDAG